MPVVDSDVLEPGALRNLNINAGLPESVPAVVNIEHRTQ